MTLACGHEPAPGFVYYPAPSAPEVCRACWLAGVELPTSGRVVVTLGHELGDRVDDFGDMTDDEVRP